MTRIVRPAFAALVLVTLSSVPVAARPVSSKGATTFTLDGQPMMAAIELTHTLHRHVAVGARYQWMNRGPMHTPVHAELAGLELNLLAFRHNAKEFQANLFFSGTGGVIRTGSGLEGGGAAALQLDAETRWLYGVAQARYVRGLAGFEDLQLLGRVGVAPWAGEADELNPWIIVQYQWMPRFAGPHVVTPMVRLLYRTLLIEAGVSLRGEPLLNVTAEF